MANFGSISWYSPNPEQSFYENTVIYCMAAVLLLNVRRLVFCLVLPPFSVQPNQALAKWLFIGFCSKSNDDGECSGRQHCWIEWSTTSFYDCTTPHLPAPPLAVWSATSYWTVPRIHIYLHFIARDLTCRQNAIIFANWMVSYRIWKCRKKLRMWRKEKMNPVLPHSLSNTLSQENNKRTDLTQPTSRLVHQQVSPILSHSSRIKNTFSSSSSARPASHRYTMIRL